MTYTPLTSPRFRTANRRERPRIRLAWPLCLEAQARLRLALRKGPLDGYVSRSGEYVLAVRVKGKRMAFLRTDDWNRYLAAVRLGLQMRKGAKWAD